MQRAARTEHCAQGQMNQALQDKQADIKIKMEDLAVKKFDAETKRLEVMKPEAQQEQPQIDPLKVKELEQRDEELRIEAYSAETERLKALGVTSPAVVDLVNQTVAQAMSNGKIGEAEAVEPAEPQEPEEPEMMPMAGPEMLGHMMPDGSVMPGPPMGGM